MIIFTTEGQCIEKLIGLYIGADDCIMKPINPEEVIARTQVILDATSTMDASYNALRIGAFEIDFENNKISVYVDSKIIPLNLTRTQFNLLTHLAKTPDRVVNRGELLSISN